jgi:DNA repair protein RadC
MNIKQLPISERPRERLRMQGSDALSTVELLAILLSTGTKKTPVMDLAARILARFGSLEKLICSSLEELMEIDGIGPAKAIQLKAAFALAHKASNEMRPEPPKIGSKEAYELLRSEVANLTQETLFVVLKDVRERLISVEKVGVGTLSQVLYHPREIFYPAVRHKAYSIIVAHNHPSGDTTPSKADYNLTKHLIGSSKVMGIHLDDHLIVGARSYFSFMNAGHFEEVPQGHV